MKIILGYNYKSYENALDQLNIDNLQSRREKLCNKFAQKCIENDQTKNMFKLKQNYRELKEAVRP